jgi:hypothetical protein
MLRFIPKNRKQVEIGFGGNPLSQPPPLPLIDTHHPNDSVGVANVRLDQEVLHLGSLTFSPQAPQPTG